MTYEDLLSARLLVGPNKPLTTNLLNDVSRQLAINATASMDRIVFEMFNVQPLSWETRLEYAIEERSIKSRIRRARRRLRSRLWDYQWRISTALDVLRGRHDCYDY